MSEIKYNKSEYIRPLQLIHNNKSHMIILFSTIVHLFPIDFFVNKYLTESGGNLISSAIINFFQCVFEITFNNFKKILFSVSKGIFLALKLETICLILS